MTLSLFSDVFSTDGFSNSNKSTLLAAVKAIGIVTIMLSTTQSANAWLEKLLPSDETYTVQAIDRDVAFLIDDYIYDARNFCYMQVGDKVIFLNGRYGLDYRASIYNLTGKERCEVLLRGRYQQQ